MNGRRLARGTAFWAIGIALATVLPWTACSQIPGSGTIPAASSIPHAPLAVTWYFSFGYEWQAPHELAAGCDKAGWENAVSEPEIGCYSSAHEETISWQLDRMRQAGISVLMLSWWGWGDHDLDGEVEGDIGASYDQAIKTALDYIKRNDLPFQFAIMVEDFWQLLNPACQLLRDKHGDLPDEPGDGCVTHRELTQDDKWRITNYLWDNFYRPETYGELAYRFFGKPLLISTIGNPGPLWGTFDDDRFTLREIYWGVEDMEWAWAAPTYVEPPSTLPGRERVAMIWPRYDETYLWRNNPEAIPWVDSVEELEKRRVDPYLQEGLYNLAWKRIIEYEPASDLELIWLWSWNSYNDMLYIEPDTGKGPSPQADLLLRKTRHYYDLYRSGEPFQWHNPPVETSLHMPLEPRTITCGTLAANESALRPGVE